MQNKQTNKTNAHHSNPPPFIQPWGRAYVGGFVVRSSRRSGEWKHSSRWPITSLRPAVHVWRVSRTRPQHSTARLGFPQSSAAKCNLDGVTERVPRGVLAAGWRIADWGRLEAKIAATSIPRVVAVFIQHNRKNSRTRLLGKRFTTLRNYSKKRTSYHWYY